MYDFNIQFVAEYLTTYAIERQNGVERCQLEHTPPWSEQRRRWTDAILQGMARLDGYEPDPKLMEQYDQRLNAARGCSTADTLPLQEQTTLIRDLSRYVSALEATGNDRRRQIVVVGSLLGDMLTHRSWGFYENDLAHAREQWESTLLRMTAQMPIRFTRVLLGGECGPCESDFVSGSVTDADSVKATALYERMSRQYPEITEWPAICTVYAGRGLDSASGTVDAAHFDIAVIRGAGDRFLNLPGIRFVGGREIKIPADEMTQGPQMNLTM